LLFREKLLCLFFSFKNAKIIFMDTDIYRPRKDNKRGDYEICTGIFIVSEHILRQDVLVLSIIGH